MNKNLICYFSASGVTREVGDKIRGAISGDLFEIEPEVLYTSDDLDWTNDDSRSSVEMKDASSRPKVKNRVNNLGDYNKVIIGFPIWWYTYPRIIDTFLEENDLSGKDIYVYVTSGSSGYNKSFNDLVSNYPNLHFVKGIRFPKDVTYDEIKEFMKEE
ncbi:MAG: NAD(P)H-dependent oxidoreductase [Bacilli bacterium]|nr:NAD(P)H-dependent oxidoreductase [Bacilli bacterium]